MKSYARWAALAGAALLIAVTACKKSAGKGEVLADPLSTTASGQSVAKKSPDRFAAPSKYATEKVNVGIDTDVTQDGKKFTIKGHAAKDAILPDGTRILLQIGTTVNHAIVNASEVVTVKGGGFECSPRSDFDGSEQLPAGDYYLEAFIFPDQQPTALQAIFGDGGANFTGSQVRPNGTNGSMVRYDQHFLKIDSPEGEATLRQMQKEIAQRQSEMRTLYQALEEMKDDPAFVNQGLSSGNGKAWLSRVRKAERTDKSQEGIYGKRIAASLEALGLAYKASKGADTKQTNANLHDFLLEYSRRLGPGYTGLMAGDIMGFVKQVIQGKTSVEGTVGLLVSRPTYTFGNFTVASTSKEYVFYSAEIPGLPSAIQIAVERVPGEFYAEGTRLKCNYYRVVGAGRFSTVMGAEKDLVILKPLPE